MNPNATYSILKHYCLSCLFTIGCLGVFTVALTNDLTHEFHISSKNFDLSNKGMFTKISTGILLSISFLIMILTAVNTIQFYSVPLYRNSKKITIYSFLLLFMFTGYGLSVYSLFKTFGYTQTTQNKLDNRIKLTFLFLGIIAAVFMLICDKIAARKMLRTTTPTTDSNIFKISYLNCKKTTWLCLGFLFFAGIGFLIPDIVTCFLEERCALMASLNFSFLLGMVWLYLFYRKEIKKFSIHSSTSKKSFSFKNDSSSDNSISTYLLSKEFNIKDDDNRENYENLSILNNFDFKRIKIANIISNTNMNNNNDPDNQTLYNMD